jgi:DtxR family Mn-dependent transcriptional regulator
VPKEAHVLSESLGDYLESVYHLVRENGAARVKEIAGRLRVRMSSVTCAMRSLSEKEMVNYDPYRFITLTPRGRKIARDLVRRHRVLTRFFHEVIGLDPVSADRNACHVEHAIEPRALEGLVVFLARKGRRAASRGTN